MGNAPSYPAPYAAQINAVYAPLDCTVNGNPNATFNTYITTTAPLSAGTGTSISYTDFTARLRFPDFITGAAGFYKSTYYKANATIKFDIVNASPSSFTLTELNVTHSWSYPFLDFPVNASGVLPPIGPVKLGAVGRSDLQLTSIDILLRLFRADGSFGDTTPPILITCNEPPLPILASVIVDRSTSSGVLAPANNAQGSFPATPTAYKTTSANIPVTCEHDGGTLYPPDWNYTFTATAPYRYLGQDFFNITNIQNEITVPGSVIAALTASRSQRTTCGVFLDVLPQNGVPGLAFSLSYAAPASADLSTNFVASDASTPQQLSTGRYVDCGSASPVTFSVPNLGYLNLTNIAAVNQSGPVFSLDIKDIGGTITGINSQTGASAKQVWTCTPKTSLALLTAPLDVPPCVVCQGDGCPPYSCPT